MRIISGLVRRDCTRQRNGVGLLPVNSGAVSGRDLTCAENTIDEPFQAMTARWCDKARYSRRVVYAIQHMFGIEFAPAVRPRGRKR